MERVIDILNRLLAAEYGSLVHRLAECDPYVTWPAAADRAVVQRMLNDLRAHQRDLVAMILSLRGSPAPPTYPTSLGGAHFLKLSYLMPQVVASVRTLVRTYEAVGPTGHAEVDALLARILADHKRHLAELERLHSYSAAPVAAGQGRVGASTGA